MTQDRESYPSGLGSSSLNESQPESISDRASEMSSTVQDQASEYGQKIQEQADTGIDKAASGLQKAADQMRSRMNQQGGTQGQVGTKVADGLEKSATYLRDHEANEIWDDVEQWVKDHPIQSAAGAAVAGFVIARILR